MVVVVSSEIKSILKISREEDVICHILMSSYSHPRVPCLLLAKYNLGYSNLSVYSIRTKKTPVN